jgi:hypothetical protein
MITSEELSNIVYVIEYHLNNYSNDEITGYKNGSYFKSCNSRSGTSFLELYYLILTHSLDILNYNLDYKDFGIKTSDLIYAIDKSNELMFYYGKYDTP